ncbi:MAG: hypothetical protein ACLFT5_01610 [Desulfovermiculus sp.]
MSTGIELLEQSLRNHFGAEAADLAQIFDVCLDKECTSYAEIDLPEEDKNESLLTAFEERALVPVQIRPSQGWDSCGLRLTAEESYFMPRVVRILLTHARDTGRLDTKKAVQEVLAGCSTADAGNMALLFEKAKSHVRSFKFEAGLLHQLGQNLEGPFDLHASMDFFVLAGMMSPCTGMSVPSGLAWFEVNPSLFWE